MFYAEWLKMLCNLLFKAIFQNNTRSLRQLITMHPGYWSEALKDDDFEQFTLGHKHFLTIKNAKSDLTRKEILNICVKGKIDFLIAVVEQGYMSMIEMVEFVSNVPNICCSISRFVINTSSTITQPEEALLSCFNSNYFMTTDAIYLLTLFPTYVTSQLVECAFKDIEKFKLLIKYISVLDWKSPVTQNTIFHIGSSIDSFYNKKVILCLNYMLEQE